MLLKNMSHSYQRSLKRRYLKKQKPTSANCKVALLLIFSNCQNE